MGRSRIWWLIYKLINKTHYMRNLCDSTIIFCESGCALFFKFSRMFPRAGADTDLLEEYAFRASLQVRVGAEHAGEDGQRGLEDVALDLGRYARDERLLPHQRV